jgi:hypothetical protein
VVAAREKRRSTAEKETKKKRPASERGGVVHQTKYFAQTTSLDFVLDKLR